MRVALASAIVAALVAATPAAAAVFVRDLGTFGPGIVTIDNTLTRSGEPGDRAVDLFLLGDDVAAITLLNRIPFLNPGFDGQFDLYFLAPEGFDAALDPDLCNPGEGCLIRNLNLSLRIGGGAREPGLYALIYEFTSSTPVAGGVTDSIRYVFDLDPVPPVVPLPAAAPLLAAGLAGLVAIRRTRRG